MAFLAVVTTIPWVGIIISIPPEAQEHSLSEYITSPPPTVGEWHSCLPDDKVQATTRCQEIKGAQEVCSRLPRS